MLLWCVAGSGRVCVNGKWFPLLTDDWLFLPWGREIRYHASESDPFTVGGIHLIPAHRKGAPVRFEVAHDSGHPLAGSSTRKDRVWPNLEGVVTGNMAGSETLRMLATYIVERFHSERNRVSTMTHLAELLIDELTSATSSSSRPLPALLARMMQVVREHMDHSISIPELAARHGCGEATVHRLFKCFLETTPAHWMAGVRAGEAARLLRTTNLSLPEVGRRIGIADAFQFSRFFKRHHGLSPRAWQKVNIPFPDLGR